MPDDNGSAAQPVIDYFKNGVQKIQKITGTAPPPALNPAAKNIDLKYHAGMVDRANESFRRKAEEDQKTTPIDRKEIIRKPVARKR